MTQGASGMTSSTHLRGAAGGCGRAALWRGAQRARAAALGAPDAAAAAAGRQRRSWRSAKPPAWLPTAAAAAPERGSHPLAVPQRLVALLLGEDGLALVRVCERVVAAAHEQVGVGEPARDAIVPRVELHHPRRLPAAQQLTGLLDGRRSAAAGRVHSRLLRLLEHPGVPKVEQVEDACGIPARALRGGCDRACDARGAAGGAAAAAARGPHRPRRPSRAGPWAPRASAARSWTARHPPPRVLPRRWRPAAAAAADCRCAPCCPSGAASPWRAQRTGSVRGAVAIESAALLVRRGVEAEEVAVSRCSVGRRLQRARAAWSQRGRCRLCLVAARPAVREGLATRGRRSDSPRPPAAMAEHCYITAVAAPARDQTSATRGQTSIAFRPSRTKPTAMPRSA
jgi:hypothetical protein